MIEFQTYPLSVFSFPLVLLASPHEFKVLHIYLVATAHGLRISYNAATTHRGADHDAGADQHDVLDDVLTLQRGRIGDAGEDLRGEDQQRRGCAKHLQKKQ